MPPAPTIPEGGRRFAVRLALFYAANFALLGAYQPFFPLWLKASGFDAGWIGVVAAVPTLTRLVAVPMVIRAAERHHAIRGAMVMAAIATFVGFVLLGSAGNPPAIILMLALTACAWTPIAPLTDAYALRVVAIYRINYGPVRLWGSAAYMVGALAVGWLAGRLAPSAVIWVIAATAGLGALMSVLIEPLERPVRLTGQPSKASALLRDPAFLAVMAAAALIQGSHAGYYTFSAIAWQAVGLDTTTISLLWAVGIVAEIALFAVSPRVKISSAGLMICGGIAAALRWTITAFDPPLAVLVLAQGLHALSFGATFLGTISLVARLAPSHVGASAQGYIAVSTGLVTATVSTLCGQSYGSLGLSIYYGMAALALAGGLVMVLSRHTVARSLAGLAP